MPQLKGKQSLLDAALGEFVDYGFSLKEVDDHLTELYFKDKKIATYTCALTISILHEGCRNFLRNLVVERLAEGK